MDNSTKSDTPGPSSKKSSITGAPPNLNTAKPQKSGNFLSMLSSLEAQLDKDDIPDSIRLL